MKNEKFLELKLLFEQKKKNINLSEVDNEKIKNLEYLLKNEDLFFNIDFQTAYGILEFLGVNENEIIDYYFELIAPKNLTNKEPVYVTISNQR